MASLRVLAPAVLLGSLFVALAPSAHAQEERLPAYGPTSIAVPAEWAQGGQPAPRLARTQPTYPAPTPAL